MLNLTYIPDNLEPFSGGDLIFVSIYENAIAELHYSVYSLLLYAPRVSL
jgi:hypothetical protein